MELMTDISSCSLPIDNVKATVAAAMAQTGIKALFQTEQVFHKKKRVILFDIATNLMDGPQRSEIVQQASLDHADLHKLLADETGRSTAQRLEGMPLATYESIISSVQATSDTVELLQTLKTMGYVVGLLAPASTLFLERLSAKLDIDHCYGIPYEIDDDNRSFTGAIESGFSGIDRRESINAIIAKEKISPDEVTVINTGTGCSLPGIHPVFDLGTVLGLYNKHSISKELLTALIASFGTGVAA